MMVTAIENFLFFSSLLSLLCYTVAWAVRRGEMKKWWQPHPQTLARLYAAAVAFPPALGAWLVAASLLPQAWLGEQSFAASHPAPHHQLHLLGDLTASLEPGLAYATLVFALAATSFAVWSVVRGYLGVSSVIDRLGMNSTPPASSRVAFVEQLATKRRLGVGVVLSDYPFSFVWGFGRSRLVLSSGLLCVLTEAELAGLLEHEAAHHVRRDNLTKLALALLGHLSLAFPLSWRLLQWRAEQVEMICDEVAAARTTAPLEIAEALVKLRRLTRHIPGIASSAPLASSFCPDDASGFERRVLRIVALAETPPDAQRAQALSRSPAGEALSLAATFAMTLLLIIALMPLAVHEIVETLIRFIR
ncbi:MAG: M56 family metallopeptidase [Acidobacteria bacterium]|nr:M56 family metallopeptidase [Acidobacteriota bacterium]